MKKILSVFLAIALVITANTSLTFAIDENIKTNNTIAERNDEGLKVLSETKKIVAGELLKVTKYETESGVLESTLGENMVTIRDESGEIVFIATYYEKEDSSSSINVFNYDNESVLLLASGLAEQYDRWRSPVRTTTYVVRVGAIKPTIDALASAVDDILSAVCPWLLAYTVLSFAREMHEIIHANSQFNVAAELIYNFYCNILVKETIVGEVPADSLTARGVQNVNWTDSPWIYGVHPEACRFLTELY